MDEQIIIRAAGGDTGAFRAFMEHYSNAVYGAAYGIVGDFHIAQDLTQEVFMRSYRGLAKLADPGAAGSWLYTMTRRLCIDWLRKNRNQPVPVEHTAELADSRQGELLRRQQMSIDVWDALQTLEEDNRTAIVLQMYGYSMEEIGRFLGLTVKAVDSRIRRTRIKLKKELIRTMDGTIRENRLDAPAFAEKVASTLLFPKMLRFPNPQLSDELMDKVKRQFEENHPELTLNVYTVHNYHDKLRQYMAEHQAPDLILMDSARGKEYDRLGYLADLTPYLQRDNVNTDDFIKPFQDLMTVDGEVIGIPLAGATMAVFYNKSWFDRAGLPHPEAEWTWETFAETAKVLMASEGDPKQWKYGASLYYHTNILEPIVLSRGGRFISPDGTRVKGYLDSPETIAALQWAADLIHVHKAAAPMVDYGFRRLFWEGRMGMIVDYIDAMHGITKNMKEPFGTAPMPKFADGARVNVAAAGAIGISSQAANPEAAWLFLKQMLISRSALSELHAVSEIANTHSLLRDLGHRSDPIRKIFIDELEHAVPSAGASSLFWETYFSGQINSRLLHIVKNKADVEETLQWAAESIEYNLDLLSRLRS
ncbi:extracellular solute-binding protein [Paenibacillus mesophilus]|uniref:extracellular solute-binding protein n=1 Tax=Paenibacillus mesophilus TaxID=2582849 RepID=UPI0013052522|nr:extracellular solute-binding protein [Paenibacillus mesophilus]